MQGRLRRRKNIKDLSGGKVFIVVCYDIRDEKRLRRVAKEMEGWGVRVQKSVFECDMKMKDFQRMRKRLLKLIEPERDSLRFYFLCKSCREKILIEGVGEYYEDEKILVI